MSDLELITRARHGDEAAWESLVSQYQAAAFRLAYLLMGDPDEAQDIAQEAFIRAFRALERFDAARPFRPWLLRITANLARNQRRSIGRYIAALRRLVGADPDLTSGAQEDSHSQSQEAQALWQAVQRLSLTDQQVVYLRYFMDLSEAEMALALEIAPGTVKSRLHRALGRLRAVVETEFPMLREEQGA